MQEGDREKVTVEKDNGTRGEISSCDRRKHEGKKGSESRCVEREVNNSDGDRKNRIRGKGTTEKAAGNSTTREMQHGGATLRQ